MNRTSNIFGRTRKQINIHRRYRKSIWTVNVDVGQIEQVFLNLYVNAWQAMPNGGDLYLETDNVVLDGKYVRSMSLPTHVNGDKISATFDNGVLELRIPKGEETKPKRIEVKAQLPEAEGKKRQRKPRQKSS